MARPSSVFVIPSLLLGLTICFLSLTTVYQIKETGAQSFPSNEAHKSSRRGLSQKRRSWNHHPNGSTETENNGNVAKHEHLERRTIGDDIQHLKHKAKKASTAYRWLKRHWQQLLVIFFAIFSLVAVVVFYRKCCSDTSADDNDEESNVIVVNVPRSLDSRRNEIDREALGRKDGFVSGNENQPADRSVTRETEQKSFEDGITATMFTSGKTYQHRKVADFLDKEEREQEIGKKRLVFGASKTKLCEAKLIPASSTGIPVSGYTALQQVEFSQVPLDVNQYLCEVKTLANELGAQPVGVVQGHMSDGPFPLYEEIPLITNLRVHMLERCNSYIPTANTKTNLPLTVSP